MEPIGDSLKNTASALGLERIEKTISIKRQWESIVGEAIAAKSSPAGMRQQTLLVQTAAPIWSHQLNMLKEVIIAKLKSEGFEISDLRFVVAQAPEKKPPTSPPAIDTPPDFNDVPGGIKDSKLGRALASYLGAVKIKRKTKK